MIGRVTGTVVEVNEKSVTLETSGIGYTIFTPQIFELGKVLTLYTHLVIRDDAHELYGFETAGEKSLFITLIGVNGVGPKTALHMLSLYPLTQLVRVIRSSDSKAISLVPGIGKKTAEKIVIDLKDKLDSFEASDKGPQNDLIEALLSLGYKEHQVRQIIPSIDSKEPLQKQITSALRMLK